MRIRIEVEVAPEEVPLATELLGLLRQLSDHVSVKTTDGPTTSTASRGPSPLPPVPANNASAAVTPSPPAPRPTSSASDYAGPPAAAPAAAGAAPAVAAAAAPAAAAAAPAVTFPPGTPPPQQIMQLIQASEFAENPEPLARQLESILQDPALGGPATMFPVFVDIWSSIALNPNLPAEERSAAPFVMLLQPMGQPFREKFRDRIMRDLLKHLTVLRPIDANRGEYYVHAEVFAALVSIEIVHIDGAIQTMCTLAKNPEKRGAAVTMLGKTVELAGHMIAERVPAQIQEMMRTTVAGITDEAFHYDVEYINSTMGWGGADAASAVPSAPRTLRPVRSLAEGHNEMVFALAVDAAHHQFVSGGKDSYLRVWSQDGQAVQRLELGDLYISSMDFHPRLNMLLCSCLNPTIPNSLRLAGFISGQPNGFGAQGFVQREEMVAVAAVRALPETTGFLTGETIVVGKATAPVIRYWDTAAAHSFQALQPTQTFRGLGAIATALRGVGGEASLFVSGDKDGCMQMWDLRAPKPMGAFGTADASGTQRAHATMVTSIESTGPLLVSGGTDKTVAVWDVRQMGQPALSRVSAEQMTVLKLALNATHKLVAVSATNGLRLLDISNPTASVLSAPLELAWPDGRRRGTYHDLKWNESLNLLYAAGKDKIIDMYTLA